MYTVVVLERNGLVQKMQKVIMQIIFALLRLRSYESRTACLDELQLKKTSNMVANIPAKQNTRKRLYVSSLLRK